MNVSPYRIDNIKRDIPAERDILGHESSPRPGRNQRILLTVGPLVESHEPSFVTFELLSLSLCYGC